MFRQRGRAMVFAQYCKIRLPYLRLLTKSTMCRYLHEAGMAYLTKRLKTPVSPARQAARVEYCQWLLAKQKRTLACFAYTDGTTSYWARGPVEFSPRTVFFLAPNFLNKLKSIGRSIGSWVRQGTDSIWQWIVVHVIVDPRLLMLLPCPNKITRPT